MNKLKTGAMALAAGAVLLMQSALAQTSSFEAWLEKFRVEAAAAGISKSVFDEAFEGVTINETVYKRNDNQPEFARAIWDYLDSAVSETRIKNGRASLSENRIILSLIDEKYSVDAEIIVAIWGLESAYGAVMGDFDAIRSFATLAYRGRRTAFGRQQLIGALKIIQNGYASRAELKGSWAGAMGHTQFIPTTYLAYAVDHDGDNKRDIWNNLGDVFASTANYLSASRYRADQPWGVEIALPAGFDYALADKKKKAVVEWAGLGIDAAHGGLLTNFDPNLRGRIIVPAGANGPAFLVFENFEAILRYNRSTAYALAVAMLADEIAGRSKGLANAWPRSDRALTLSERKQLQRALASRGYNPGPADGIIGAGTKAALRRWQQATGLPADGYASAAILDALTQ